MSTGIIDYPQNLRHADFPHVGDYWHEMHCPIARVLAVDEKRVLMQRLSGCGGKEISETDPKPHIMSRQRFARWLRYETIPDKTWASVIPRRFA